MCAGLYPLFGIAHRITSGDIAVDEDTTLPAGSVLCFNYQAFHQTGYEDPERFDPARWEHLSPKDASFIPFGVAANRPCPAWHLAPIAMRAVTDEILRVSACTRRPPTPGRSRNRAPCLLVRRGSGPPPGLGRSLTAMCLRDQAGDVGRSVKQLVLGTYMVWDAQRKRLCERHFAETSAGIGTVPPRSSAASVRSGDDPAGVQAHVGGPQASTDSFEDSA